MKKKAIWAVKRCFRQLLQQGKQAMQRALIAYRNVSMRQKLPFALCVQILLPLLVISVMCYLISAQTFRDKSAEHARTLLEATKFRIIDYIDGLSTVSQSILYDKQIYEVLNRDTGAGALSDYQLTNQINNSFKRILLTRSDVQTICLISSDKSAYISETGSKSSERMAIPYDTILAQARKAQGKAVWVLETQQDKALHVYLARTIYNQNNFQEIGLLVLEAKKSSLEELCRSLTSDEMQSISIVSAGNLEIVSASQEGFAPLNSEFVRQNYENSGTFIDRAQNALITFVSVEDPDWLIFSSTSLKSLYREIDLLRRWILFLVLITVLIMLAFSWFFVWDFLKPVNALVDTMKQVDTQGELPHVQVDRGDEFGFLEKSYNAMADKMNYLVKWNYQEQITRKEAELKALQAQISPHFLFNTLESINWMAQMNHVQPISDMVTALSKLMEVSIARDDKLITLAEEVTYIRHYMSIMQTRFGDRMEMRISLPQEVENFRIPKLLIQPLVENAVYHGLDKKRGRKKGIILLRAYRQGDLAVIEVVDNGAGMSEEELDILKELFSMDSREYFQSLKNRKRKSVGLENVNRRVKLFFGEDYNMEIASVQGHYTKIRLVIPSQYEDGEPDDA